MSDLEISAEEFRRLAHALADFGADYLASLPTRRAFPAALKGEVVQSVLDGPVPLDGMGPAALDALKHVFEFSRPNSPRFFGYVFGSGLPTGALGDFAASVLNPNVTAWRSGPSGVTIERSVVRWLAEAIGCEGFSGSLTTGGSQANLMGLCMARESRAPANQHGVRREGAIYCSAEAHMSIPKAAMLLGLGHDHVRRVAVDEQFRMRTAELRASIDRDLKAGVQPIAVVASAGTVSTGSIDPLEEIAAICREHSIWLHVDGAYGALAAFAIPEKFAGLRLADSLSLDPHKWLYQPAGCGCFLYRDPDAARRAFSHTEDYARSLCSHPVEGFAFFEESIELSRPFRALKLWLSLRYFGLRAFQARIADDLRLAQRLAELIHATSQLELLAPVALSAVCFRFTEAATENLDGLNAKILQRVIERGRVYISNATIHGKFALRACIVNHRTTEADVSAVVTEVLAAAAEV